MSASSHDKKRQKKNATAYTETNAPNNTFSNSSDYDKATRKGEISTIYIPTAYFYHSVVSIFDETSENISDLLSLKLQRKLTEDRS